MQSLYTWYKTGCTPPPQKWKVASGPEALKRRLIEERSRFCASAISYSQSGSTTILLRLLKKSDIAVSAPGQFSNRRLYAPKTYNKQT